MSLGWIILGMMVSSLVCAGLDGNAAALSAAVLQGAQSGITLAISIGGSICLWTGVGRLLEKSGLTAGLAKLLRPLLGRIFPDMRKDAVLSGYLSGNFCANFFGLGNAATPLGLQAVKRMQLHTEPGFASDPMCRLIVLNTASIQLIPANVAALRASLGCASPFDILPAVWVTSLCSAAAGVGAAWALGRLWQHG